MAAATIPVGFEVAGDRRQLEEDFLELLIASERVGNLVDVIKDTSNFHRCHFNQEFAVYCRIIAYHPLAAVIVHPLTRTETAGLDGCRRKHAVRELAQAVQSRETSAVEVGHLDFLVATWVHFACIWMLLLLPS